MVDQTAAGGSVGAGQQDPIDSNSDWYVISFMIAQKIAELEIMMPVQVTAVHPGSGSPPAAGTVDVQLLVSLLDGAGNAVQQGIVYGLPYFRLQGGAWAIICDPAAKDFGFIISASRDITSVKAKPGIQNPGSIRKHSYSDGIFIPAPFSGAPPAGTINLKPDGTWTFTDKPGNVLQGDGNGITATPVSGKPFTVKGDLNVTGKIIGDDGSGGQVSLLTHTHGGVTTGGGVSGSPTPGS